MSMAGDEVSGIPVVAYIGLGSNLEQPLEQLHTAVLAMMGRPGLQVEKVSRYYASAPIGGVEQPEFVNAVAKVTTTLSAPALMQLLLDIETAQRRQRGVKNGPRTLDLDILLYGDRVIDDEQLVIPHPRAHERAFVLLPLLELAPDVVIPGKGPAVDYLASVAEQAIAPLSQIGEPALT
jgi:2-amino-4-hydroxy-6-hydroxymethyldihydropteridine diphosphokinase